MYIQLLLFEETPVNSPENPFDKELEEHLENLVEDDFPLHWNAMEGCVV